MFRSLAPGGVTLCVPGRFIPVLLPGTSTDACQCARGCGAEDGTQAQSRRRWGMIRERNGTRRCASRHCSAGVGKIEAPGRAVPRHDCRKALDVGASPNQAHESTSRAMEGATMTRVDAIRVLLEHARRNDPEEFRALMCELLGVLGFADVDEAFDYLIDREAPPHFPIL